MAAAQATEGRRRQARADERARDVSNRILAITVGIALVSLVVLWRNSFPYEDAAMLFRYAENVVAGHGVVWNPGGPHVDGATDLGFMFLLAAFVEFGLSSETAALAVNSVAFLTIAAILYVFGTRRCRSSGIGAFLAIAFMGSPALAIMAGGFGAVTFAAFLVVAFLTIVALMDEPTHRRALVAGVACSLPGLIRPEGVLIVAVFAAMALVDAVPLRRLAVVAVPTALTYGLLTAWRWANFGYPLPNPYYKKGGGILHLDGLMDAIRFVFAVGLLPLVAICVTAFFLRGTDRRRWLAYVSGLAALLGMWILVSSEMNHSYRFEFPIFVIALVMLADLAPRAFGPSLERFDLHLTRRLGALAALLLIGLLYFPTMWHFAVDRHDREPQAEIAAILHEHADPNAVVVTTEAGYVCWKSGWRCIDAWGLNDKKIAHTHHPTQRELAEIAPLVLFVHAPTSPLMKSVSTGPSWSLRGWDAMTTPMIRFAEQHDYVLAAVVDPTLRDGYFVYVRPGEPDSESLIEAFGALRPRLSDVYGRPGPDGRFHLPTSS